VHHEEYGSDGAHKFQLAQWRAKFFSHGGVARFRLAAAVAEGSVVSLDHSLASGW